MSYATVKEEKKRVDFDIYILSCQKKKRRMRYSKLKKKTLRWVVAFTNPQF